MSRQINGEYKKQDHKERRFGTNRISFSKRSSHNDLLYQPIKCLHSNFHYVKIVRIWSYSGPYFPTFVLNMDRYGVSLRI